MAFCGITIGRFLGRGEGLKGRQDTLEEGNRLVTLSPIIGVLFLVFPPERPDNGG